jgi:hypothetical protein
MNFALIVTISTSYENLFSVWIYGMNKLIDWRRHVPLKCWLTLDGPHSVISQKRELVITAAVRTPQYEKKMFKVKNVWRYTSSPPYVNCPL